MARKPRNNPHSEFHHLTNRGARRSNIYVDDFDRELFLDLIDRAHTKFDLRIHAFCLMGNHYHLVAQFPERNMSQVMHWIGLCYAQTINQKYGYDGRLCKDRFYNSPIEDDAYFLNAVRYVHQNPKDLGVADFASYPSSSYAMYLDLVPAPLWLRTDLLMGMFNNNISSMSDFMRSTPALDFEAQGKRAS